MSKTSGPGPGREQWSRPDDALVREAVRRIGDPQHRRAFFLELANPNWVEPLRRAGFFKFAPPLRVDDDGSTRVIPWAPSQYLARMAAEAPEDVARAIQEMDEGGNPAVERDAVEAASRMPAGISKRLVGKVVRYLGEAFSSLIDPYALVRLLGRLLREGETTAGSRLADALYDPRPIDQASADTLPAEATAGLDAYWYKETLAEMVPALVQGLGIAALRTTMRWLENWQRITRQGSASPQTDVSYMWRPSIKEHAQNQRMSIGDALVDATRDVSWRLIEQGSPLAEVLSILEGSSYPIMHRIAFHLLAGVLADAPNTEAVNLASERLLNQRSLDVGLRHEYSELARATIPRMNEVQLHEWRSLISRGPDINDADLAVLIARISGSNPEEVSEAEISRWRRIWERDVLAAAREVLPESVNSRLVSLETELGVRQHPEFPAWTEASWTGPESPISRSELGAMTADDLLTHLRSWAPNSGQLFGPSREGLGRELTEAVHEEPELFEVRVQDVITLDPTYIRAVIRGWELAVSDERSVPWISIVPVLEFVALQQDEGDTPNPTSLDRDPGWRWAHQAVAMLLQRGFRADSALAPAIEMRGRIWTVIRALTNSPHPSVEYEAYYGGDNMDPLTLSLNVVRGQAMRAAVAYLTWLRTRNVVQLGTSAAIVAPEVYKVLDAHLDSDQDPSAAVRSIYGEHFPFLLSLSADWSRSRAEQIFGPIDRPEGASEDIAMVLGDVAWAAFVSVHGPNRYLYDALSDHYRSRVRRIGIDPIPQLRGARTPPGRLAEHILLLYSQGVIGLATDDGLIKSLFKVASSGLRREALSHLGWLLSRSKGELPADTLQRLTALWEWRETQAEMSGEDDELSGFSWWFRSGRFSEDWSVPHLVRAARASTPLEMPIQVVEQLGTLANRYTDAALAVLDALVSREPGDWQAYAVVEYAPPILAAALGSSDEAIRERGRRILDRLGRLGHLSLKDRVDELLANS